MSGISSVGSSASSYSLNISASFSSPASSKSSSSCGAGAQGTSPEDFLKSELEQQGYSGTALDDLLTKIQDAVKGVQTANGDGSKPDPKAIHDAVNKVLADAGVDTNKIDQDFAAQHPHRHHGHGHKKGGESSDATSSSIDQLLLSLGVDPKKFADALNTAVQNAGSDGSIDVSKLFASAAAGSQVDVTA
jgi:hypothetical protein